MKSQSLFRGTLTLMLAGLTSRLLGFGLRVILVKLIGDQGLGLFQMIYPLFITILLLSTAGLPTALARLIPEQLASGDHQAAWKLLIDSLKIVLVLGTLGAMFIYLLADTISLNLYHDPRTFFPLITLIPALVLTCLTSIFKGYFQGYQSMIPTAVSQIIEQISRILGTLILLKFFHHFELKFQAAALGLGISIGEFASLIILVSLMYTHLIKTRNPSITRSKGQQSSFVANLFQLAKIGIPITLGRMVNSIMLTLEAILIPGQLKSMGNSLGRATALYGQLGGMVEQLIYLPTVVTSALTTSLIPSIARASTLNNYKKIGENYQDALRIATYLGFPLCLIFYKHGPDICWLIFKHREAGRILSSLALACPFIYYLQISSGILHGLGQPGLHLRHLAAGSLIKLLGIYYLIPFRGLGITGATVGLTLGYAVSSFLNYRALSRKLTSRPDFILVFARPLLATLCLSWLDPRFYQLLITNLPSFKGELLVGLHLLIIIFLYLVIMLVIGGFKAGDLEKIRH